MKGGTANNMTNVIYIIIAAVAGLAAGYIVRKQVGESIINEHQTR